MATARATLVAGADNLIELGPPNGLALQDTTDSSYPTNATVTGTLYLQDTPVANTTITLAYVAGTTGANTVYRGVIPASVPLVIGATYEFRGLAVDASGNKRPVNLKVLIIEG
jgi:hypothetical protein